MAKQYYIKKDPAVSGPDVEWIAINGKEFYQLITSPAGKGRYFIDMDEFMIESTEAEYKDWRKEKDHTDYLHEQESQVQLLPLYDGEEGGPGGLIPDLSASTEEQAMACIVRKSLNEALSSLDEESYMIIDALILGHNRRSERDLAAEFGLSQKAINKRKQKILKNLELLVLKPEKSSQ
ncbi:MAG: hypothetical protein K2L38_03890 [Dysosmobacter sp.]|nr:hypothetical protein [Dysosmobacter sp.]